MDLVYSCQLRKKLYGKFHIFIINEHIYKPIDIEKPKYEVCELLNCIF